MTSRVRRVRSERRTPGRRRGTFRVLVADDNPSIRSAVRGLLEIAPGWEVCGEAANGSEAVGMAQALKPHVAILDLRLPGMDGIEVARRISAGGSKVRMVLFTSYATETEVAAARAAGVHACVFKSEGGERLLEILGDVAQSKRRLRGRRLRKPRDRFHRRTEARPHR